MRLSIKVYTGKKMVKNNQGFQKSLQEILEFITPEIPENSSRLALELIKNQEWGITLEFMYDWIDESEIPISSSVYSAIEDLAKEMKISSREWSSLQEYIIPA
jgi:nuclear transport factor 2 (NTF2) superfamily protein